MTDETNQGFDEIINFDFSGVDKSILQDVERELKEDTYTRKARKHYCSKYPGIESARMYAVLAINDKDDLADGMLNAGMSKGKLATRYDIQEIRTLYDFLNVPDYEFFIYFLVDAGTVVYVGQSTELPVRLGGHIKSRIEKEKMFDSIYYLPCETKARMNGIERWYIVLLAPKYNKAMKVNVPKYTERQSSTGIRQIDKQNIEAQLLHAATATKGTYIYDDTLKGFGVYVGPKNKTYPKSKVSYFIEQRSGGRRSKKYRYVFAQYPEIDPDRARERATKLIAQVRNGIDITARHKDTLVQ